MKWLIIEKDKALGQALCHLLIPLGIFGIVTETPEKAKEIWQRGGFSGAIIDWDSHELQAEQLIGEFKSLPSEGKSVFIAHTASNTANHIVKIHNQGFSGIIEKPFDLQKISLALQSLVEKINANGSEKRNHLRIFPDPDDMMRVFFKTSAKGPLLAGKVINISMGGMAMEILQPLKKAGSLSKNTLLFKLEVIVDSHSLVIPSIITLNKGKFLAVKFKQLNFQNKGHLARYIYKRISKTAGSLDLAAGTAG
ncbi:MAG: hypothetical protein JXR70_18380 [Spirochaetales bacterium]|nr:hypothetical protein [Spirochaetales bacterium]